MLVVDVALFIARWVVQIQGGHLEHFAGTFAVGGGDERRVDVIEASLGEELVDGEHHGVAQTHDGPEGVGTETQVCDVAQKLQGVLLRLQWVFVGVGGTEQSDFLHGEFHGLAATH